MNSLRFKYCAWYLGAGPLAADDLHILDLEMFKWLPHQTSGE